jgi:Xaa-Pro aminopeptidase
MQLDAIQAALREARLDGWLLYDFRGSNPIARRLAGFAPEAHLTRRWFGWIPASGEPTWLHHAIEAQPFATHPGRRLSYAGWRELESHLSSILSGGPRVAMEYSPGNAIPYVSRVDAGTLEMVRAAGARVETSADLVSRFEATWSEAGLASHRRAAAILARCARETHAHLAASARRGEEPTEYEVQQRMAAFLRGEGLFLDGEPIVAVDAHASNPHYAPPAEGSARIRRDQVVLLDLWGRLAAEDDAISADITWMAFLGERVPEEVQRVWEAVAGARDAAVAFLQERSAAGAAIHGREADDVAREFLRARGLDAHFIHRLGHSIAREVHGNGANLDHFETRDERRLLPRTGFSIEPGVYLPERFGVRSEIDAYWGPKGIEVTTEVQRALPALLG